MIDAPAAPTPPATNQDWMAYAALTLGLLSCAFSCLTGVPAIVLGALALNKVTPGAKPFAIGGLVTGALTTVAFFVAFFFVGGLAFLGASLDEDFQDAQQQLDNEPIENWDEEE